uniref:Uncharacterized protein B12F1.120 n=1 Tax=Neurospora crassa TaxID=5141 RepID=Q9P3H1_NEUCS|nr:hypothetical protein [Neurospora crassa]
MPTDSTPGPISHTEGTAMPCHAMLCDSMPANRSDRQQYDWSVPPGGKMTSEEAQNWQSEILCFFEPDPFQKFSKVPVSQSRFPGRLFRTSRLLGRPRGRWSCALARLATLLQRYGGGASLCNSISTRMARSSSEPTPMVEVPVFRWPNGASEWVSKCPWSRLQHGKIREWKATASTVSIPRAGWVFERRGNFHSSSLVVSFPPESQNVFLH